jgi:hypothetical protein
MVLKYVCDTELLGMFEVPISPLIGQCSSLLGYGRRLCNSAGRAVVQCLLLIFPS